ncbi:MAG: 30S ribosomal protein S20 [Capsulimonadaceae bacterium]
MPNIKSVAKDVIRSRQRQLRNQATKSQIKTYVKKAKSAIAAANPGSTDAADTLSKTFSVIDKAAKRGIIHRNAAARRKSRLARRLNVVLAA